MVRNHKHLARHSGLAIDALHAQLLRVVPHLRSRKSAVAAAEACVACLGPAIGVTPRCFYAGAMAPPDGPAVELVVCPTSLRVPFLFDGASWRTVNHVGALLRPLVLLSLATTLSMVDIQQGVYTYSIHDGHSARRINPIPIHDGHSARRIETKPNSRRPRCPTDWSGFTTVLVPDGFATQVGGLKTSSVGGLKTTQVGGLKSSPRFTTVTVPDGLEPNQTQFTTATLPAGLVLIHDGLGARRISDSSRRTQNVSSRRTQNVSSRRTQIDLVGRLKTHLTL